MKKNEIKKYLNGLCADEIKLLCELLNNDYKDVCKSKDSNHKILKRERQSCWPYCGSIQIIKKWKKKIKCAKIHL